jgi:hypothetical protein
LTLQTTTTVKQSRAPKDKWLKANRDKWNASRRSRKRPKDQNKKANARNSHIRTKYGLEPEQFDEMLEAQDFECAICTTDTPTKIGWCVDHNHSTGAVRGILCNHCNVMLGNARDNPAILLAGAQYLGN